MRALVAWLHFGTMAYAAAARTGAGGENMQNGETMMRGVGIGLEGWLVSQEPSFSDPPYIQSTLHSSHSYGKSNTIYARFSLIPCYHSDSVQPFRYYELLHPLFLPPEGEK